LTIHIENLEAQLRESQHEAEQQPKKLQEKMEKVVLEGNNARATLHKQITECMRILLEYNGCAHFTIDNISIVTQP
jgi:hypothetical protein